jgi:hypothetical protein
MDLTNLLNGSLRAVSVALVVSGATEVTKGNVTGGVILLVAGLVAYVAYEYAPDKPQLPPL